MERDEILGKGIQKLQNEFYEQLGPLSRICKEATFDFGYGTAHIVFTSKKETNADKEYEREDR